MKCWPKGLGGNVFKCQFGQECDPERLERLAKEGGPEKGRVATPPPPDEENRRSVDVENNGESRYVCFSDGFDVCNKCAEEYLTPRTTLTASTLNNTASSTSNGSAGSKQLNGGWFDVQLKTISHAVDEKEHGRNLVKNGKVIVVQNENSSGSVPLSSTAEN